MQPIVPHGTDKYPHRPRPVSHAAWDVRAVHGVHAMYSGKNLGTASRKLGRDQAGLSALSMTTSASRCTTVRSYPAPSSAARSRVLRPSSAGSSSES